jgi:hypothetical protein
MTVTITLDGKVTSSLDWGAERQLAVSAIQNGDKLFWAIDLGLFGQLKNPLSNQTQFLSLVLSLEHFRDTLWKEFEEHTAGVLLYEGSADFSKEIYSGLDQGRSILWDDELQQNYITWCERKAVMDKSLFCRDVAAEYLTMLANRMPDAMPLFIKLHLSSLSFVQEIQLTHQERFGRIQLIVNGSNLPTNLEITVGLCLPSFEKVDPKYYEGMEAAVNYLLARKIPFRVIPETYLISEWDGLDYLVVVPEGLGSQGIRKLHGFCAADGTVVSLGDPIGVAQEIPWTVYRLISF